MTKLNNGHLKGNIKNVILSRTGLSIGSRKLTTAFHNTAPRERANALLTCSLLYTNVRNLQALLFIYYLF